MNVGRTPQPVNIRSNALVINNGPSTVYIGRKPGLTIPQVATAVEKFGQFNIEAGLYYFATADATQQTDVDILEGGIASAPSSAQLAQAITDSGLSTAIASAIVASSLANDVALQSAIDALATGTHVVDIPNLFQWGPLDQGGGSGLFDVTDAQSLICVWSWTVASVANLSVWGAIQFSWWNDVNRSFLLGTDTYELGGNLNTPGTIGTSEVAFIRTPCKGAFVEVNFLAVPGPGGTGRIHADGIFIKSYRLNPISRYETNASADRVLKSANVNGLATLTLSQFQLCSPYDGPLEIVGNCSAVNTALTFIQYGWGSSQWPPSATAGRKVFTQVFFPNAGGESWLTSVLRASSRRPLWFRFGNSEAAGRDFTAVVLCSTLA